MNQLLKFFNWLDEVEKPVENEELREIDKSEVLETAEEQRLNSVITTKITQATRASLC